MKHLPDPDRASFGRSLARGPVVLFTVDPRTLRATSVTANVERETGYTPAEFLADPDLWWGALHPDDEAGVRASFETLFKKGEVHREYRMRVRGGSWRLVRDQLVLRCGPGGEPVEIVGCAYDVGQRRMMEESKRGEFALFEAMFRKHQAVMLILQPDTRRILDANDAALSFYGRSLADLRTMSLRDICADGCGCAASPDEPGGCRDRAGRHVCAGGELRDVEMRVSRIRVAERGVLFAIVSDVTESVKAQRDLAQSEARLRSLYENSTEGMFQSSLQGRFLWANPALAAILGYPSVATMIEEVTDLGTQVYFEPGERAGVLAELTSSGLVPRREFKARRRDGTAIWISASFWAVRGPDGAILRIEGVVEDITARKRAESERMLLATAVEQAAEGVAILTGGSWIVEYVNPAFNRITGLHRATLLGAAFFDFFGKGRRPMPVRDIARALTEGREWAGPVSDLKPGGEPIVAEAIFSPLRDESGRVTNAVALLRDVAHVNRLEKRLRRAGKLEAVGTLAGGIAHDFNNILTPILLNAEVGMQLLEEGDILRGPLEEILLAGGRARQLVKQILAFSRRGDLRTARIALDPIVTETVEAMRSSLPPDVELVFERDGQGLVIMADPGIVHQVVVNLADNALHAMTGRGGRLTVGLSRRAVEDGKGAPEGLAPGEYAVISVSDTGHGMDKVLMERIFTPFFTTKNPGEGTGMGLAMVYGSVRSFGGGVRVESELGKGSLFEVFLPLTQTLPRMSRPGTGGRVMVVDAQAFSRRALGMMLSDLGFKVTMMRDASRAIRAFARVPWLFDAVLAGEDLHGMSGQAFLKTCRAVRPDSRLVLLTEKPGTRPQPGAADAVLDRPVSEAALAAVLAGSAAATSSTR